MSDSSQVTVDKEELRSLIADALELPVKEIDDHTHLVEDLEVDSLMALEIVVNLEKRYGVKMEESDFKQVTSLAQVVDLVSAKLAASS
ncbi:acyl carrier protein [Streptomyces sp. RB6PN25]|uniref:Acyl carrier protein n=1 Tax=Streptomyces humicola TaxID=2953240 RepID=A0ABT1PTB2_9ACTN|nr:acyl carrier protein [Streptomyces humicola]MCQ4080916.1 acyl carrier protein [Streptomyces humicola]